MHAVSTWCAKLGKAAIKKLHLLILVRHMSVNMVIPPIQAQCCLFVCINKWAGSSAMPQMLVIAHDQL